jgi:hypothetical protein
LSGLGPARGAAANRHAKKAAVRGFFLLSSNRSRGEQAKTSLQDNVALAVRVRTRNFVACAKTVWARLIRKVYEADPLVYHLVVTGDPIASLAMNDVSSSDDTGSSSGDF